jgi:hypothetical protein
VRLCSSVSRLAKTAPRQLYHGRYAVVAFGRVTYYYAGMAFSLKDLMWLATASYGLHILEEYQLNWRDWARAVIGLPVEWSDFYVTNALVVVLGIVAANLATDLPGVSLGFPALMLINATFFHVLPTIKARRFSPGLFTAVILFYPMGVACYWQAFTKGICGEWAVIGSLLIGGLIMASPIIFLKIKDHRYFRQER